MSYNNESVDVLLDDIELIKQLRETHSKLLKEASKVVFGQDKILEFMLISLLCKGHALLLGLPGLGKTLMANTLANMLDLDFCRIQFTPDLMPSDITGTDVIEENSETGRRERKFLRGPIFANLVLADEINRTPPKTQASLLQAMQEKNVSIGRETYKLEEPFMVLATQNPIEMEGTYVLPEAQLDRFMFCLKVDYPSENDEVAIVRGTTGVIQKQVERVIGTKELQKLQDIVRAVPVSEDVIRYAVQLAAATRVDSKGVKKLDIVENYIAHGASPRASQYLILGAKAKALLNGRHHVSKEDVNEVASVVLRHRLVLNFRSRADNVDADEIITQILKSMN